MGIDKYFGENNCFTSDMVKRGKPEPDIFLLAAQKMYENPQNCIVIEDSIAGIHAGKSAGMTTFAFIGHNSPKYAEFSMKAGTDKVFDNMIELHKELIKYIGQRWEYSH